MVHELFRKALMNRYDGVKALYPTEGRRKWRLRVLYESWPLLISDSSVREPLTAVNTSFDSDSDSLDPFLEDEALGIIIRTDFTNDDAWNAFCEKVQIAQKELMSEFTNGDGAEGSEAMQVDENASDAKDASEPSASTHDEDSDSSSETPDIIKFFDPPDEADRIKLTNISSIAALRLFNDVDIRFAPSPPPGTKRISPQNPLIDKGGWQEIYTGKNLWVYDTNSITDECVRVVSQAGDVYGTASGDTWRARASHVCELQFNMSYQGLKIDFGGLDKWDSNERLRNLTECELLE